MLLWSQSSLKIHITLYHSDFLIFTLTQGMACSMVVKQWSFLASDKVVLA